MTDPNFYEIGRQHELEGNAKLAKLNYEKCLFGSYTASQFCNIAVFLNEQKDDETAVLFIERACLLEEENADYQWIAGTLYGRTGKDSLARRHYERAHKLAPTNIDILYRLVLLCNVQRDHRRVLELLNPILRTKERNSEPGVPSFAKPANIEDNMIIALSRELIDAYAGLLRECQRRQSSTPTTPTS
jgi:tetratricopeptide (TPR) repeat protein